MRNEVRRLTDVLLHGIVQDEGFARELAELAHGSEKDGSTTIAQGMLNLSRHHRIKGIKARAEMTALYERYTHLLG